MELFATKNKRSELFQKYKKNHDILFQFFTVLIEK